MNKQRGDFEVKASILTTLIGEEKYLNKIREDTHLCGGTLVKHLRELIQSGCILEWYDNWDGFRYKRWFRLTDKGLSTAHLIQLTLETLYMEDDEHVYK